MAIQPAVYPISTDQLGGGHILRLTWKSLTNLVPITINWTPAGCAIKLPHCEQEG